MQIEITAALNFIVSNLYNKLPRRRVDAFAEEVERGIIAKFKGHWYPDNPSKGAAYRCINVSGDKVDPAIIYAAINSGLDIEEVISYLPKDLTIWIDPGEVSYSIGEKGQVRPLYSERKPIDDIPATFNHPVSIGVTSPEDIGSSLSSSFGSLSLSSTSSSGSWGSPSPVPWTNSNPWSPISSANKTTGWNTTPTASSFQMPARTNNTKMMTAAMFAQTKFGSTKLKSNGKRSSRLSPTDHFSRSCQPPQSLFTTPRSHGNLSQFDRLQQNTAPVSSSYADPFSTQQKLVSSNGQQSLNGNSSPGSLSSPVGDQGWVDLTDVNIYPTGNQLLAT